MIQLFIITYNTEYLIILILFFSDSYYQTYPKIYSYFIIEQPDTGK